MAVNEIIRDQAKMSWNSLFVIKWKCFILFSLIIQGGDDRRVVVWNVEKCVYGSSSPVVMKGEHRSNIFCTVFDNDNTHIYSAGTRSTMFYQLKIWLGILLQYSFMLHDGVALFRENSQMVDYNSMLIITEIENVVTMDATLFLWVLLCKRRRLESTSNFVVIVFSTGFNFTAQFSFFIN